MHAGVTLETTGSFIRVMELAQRRRIKRGKYIVLECSFCFCLKINKFTQIIGR